MKKEIKSLTKEETILKTKDLNKSLLDMRFQIVSNQLKDFSQIKKTKKEIARLKTHLSSLNKGE